MDVHPPHGPIHSVRDFMVHLLAITIGLLIALGLESTAEWVHHRHLARNARQNIVEEIRANRQDIARQLNALPAERRHLDELLILVDATQKGRPYQPLGDFMWTGVLLRDSAWNAASSTGAVAFMQYDEVKAYAQLYAVQKLSGSLMQRDLELRHEMNVHLARMSSGDKLSDAEFEKTKHTIVSTELTISEFNEIDGMLNDFYNKLLSEQK